MCRQVLQPARGRLDATRECSVILNLGLGAGCGNGEMVAPFKGQSTSSVLVKAGERRGTAAASFEYSRLSSAVENID